ncbi:MAG TPA: PAS domain S-box protein, partial [Daejeonella sp.]|nr:PAS domain S-box protein [Daejeonella sp.]
MGNILKQVKLTFKKVKQCISIIKGQQQSESHDLQLKDILESITDGFFAVDSNWIVRYYNKAAESMLLPREQIIGKNLWDVFHDAVGSLFYQQYHRVMNERVPASFEEYYPGLNIWVQINAYPAVSGITIYFRDITESKRLLMLETLEKDTLTHYTGKGTTIESTVCLMLEGIREMHPELLCSVLEVENNVLKYFAFSHRPAAFIKETDNSEIQVGCGCLGMEAISGEKTFSPDIANDPEWETYRKLAADHQLKACVFYPLIDPWQKVIGLFSIYLNTPRALSQAEDATLEKSRYILANILQNHIAEETLKISEGKYRDLFYLHPMPLWLYSTETYRFLDVNEAAIRHYGYSLEEFLEMTIKDIRPAEDLHQVENYISSASLSGAYACGIFRHRKKTGEVIFVEIRSNNVDFNGQPARLIISTDITAKVEMERALNASEKRFKAMVQEGSDLINILDMNGAYIYASPASAAMFGKQPEEIIGSYAMNFIHEDDQEMIGRSLGEIVSTRRVQTAPYRFRLQSGEYRWLQSIGTNLLDDP